MSSTPIRPAATVTMRDIAVCCDVSLMTVSRALRDDPCVSLATRERVQQMAAELGYDPAVHQSARRLAGRRHGQLVPNNVIALQLPSNFHRIRYWADLFHGVLDVVTEEDFALLATYMELAPDDTLPQIFSRGDVDGVVAYPGSPIFSVFQQTGHPLQIVAVLVPQSGFPCVRADDFQGGYVATRHLLELGHRAILTYWGDADDPSVYIQRDQGSRQACQDCGLDPEQILYRTHLAHTDVISIRATQPLCDALERHPHITAILAPNDDYALLIHQTLHMRGIRVPEQMSLIGFDDTVILPTERGENRLTTVQVPLERIGQQAARLLIQQINGETPLDAAAEIVLPTPLIVRATTAPPRSRRD